MADRTRAVLRRDRGVDDGLTLVEMLVSMIVFGIAMAIVTSAVIAVVRMSHEAQDSSDAVFAVRQAMDTIDRQVRSGNVLFSPADETAYVSSCQAMGTNQGSCMRIFTQANGPQKCVQWQMIPDGGTGTYALRMRSWDATWQTGGAVSSWGVVARGLLMTQAPFSLEGADTPYDRRLLRVHLSAVDHRTGHQIPLDQSISGRNTSFGYDSGQCLPEPPA
jgi:prepilin-type N-terminal cleavage/methylation domain-containing protein